MRQQTARDQAPSLGGTGLVKLATQGMSAMCAILVRSDRSRPSVAGPRRGTITPLIAFGMVAMLGIIALTVDVGRMTTTKSTSQNECDAAALAGAGALPSTPPTAALDQAALFYLANRTGGTTQPVGTGTNPRTYTINGDTVTVTSPYSDTFTTSKSWSSADLIEVRVARSLQLPFGAAVGVPSTQIVSRAVAFGQAGSGGGWGGGEGCLFATDQGYALNCSNFTVKGSVYTNSDISMNLSSAWIGDTLHAKNGVTLNGSTFNGHFKLEYGTTYSVNCSSKDIAQYTKLAQVNVTPPITFVPASYATDFNVDFVQSSSWTVNGSSFTPTPGTYYINGDFNINTSSANLNGCTFIVNGSFNCNASNVTFSPDAGGLKAGGTNYMCVYSTATGGAININVSSATVNGDLYAPNGTISCNASNVHKGWWVARKISVNCSTFELDGIPGRGGGPTVKLVE